MQQESWRERLAAALKLSPSLPRAAIGGGGGCTPRCSAGGCRGGACEGAMTDLCGGLHGAEGRRRVKKQNWRGARSSPRAGALILKKKKRA